MTARSGRNLSSEYRRNRRQLLATTDLCHLCGHHGARTADHKIAPREWFARFGHYRGVDSLANLAPAHGTMGSGRNRLHNRCTQCGRLCNQSRKDRPLTDLGRDWTTPGHASAATTSGRRW